MPSNSLCRPAHFCLATLALLGVALAGGACGGAEASDLLGGAPRASDAGTALPDGGGAPDATREPHPNDGDASDDGGPPEGSLLDAHTGDSDIPAPDAGDDSGLPNPPDGHVPGTIECGAELCDVPSQVCCRTRSLTNDPIYACVASTPGACLGVAALTVPCDDAADCEAAGQPGSVCCVILSGGLASVNGVECLPVADCDRQNRNTLCDPGLPLEESCPTATSPTVACLPNPAASFAFDICRP